MTTTTVPQNLVRIPATWLLPPTISEKEVPTERCHTRPWPGCVLGLPLAGVFVRD